MNIHDIKDFSFAGYDLVCKCIAVHDGDTITVSTLLGPVFGLRKLHIRLVEIDCSEINSPTEPCKSLAVLARDFLAGLILDRTILVRCDKFDMYGRVLGDIYTYDNEQLGINVNRALIENGHAVPYYGKDKKKNAIDMEIAENINSLLPDDIVAEYKKHHPVTGKRKTRQIILNILTL